LVYLLLQKTFFSHFGIASIFFNMLIKERICFILRENNHIPFGAKSSLSNFQR